MKSFFILVWIMFSCTNAPIHNQVIRHGVIDYYELIEPLGIKHLYREKPVVNKDTIYYCLIHKSTEIIWILNMMLLNDKKEPIDENDVFPLFICLQKRLWKGDFSKISRKLLKSC